MPRPLAGMAAMLFLLGIGACGGGGSPTTSTPNRARATVLVSQTSVGLVGYSARPEHQLCLRLPVEIRETAGVGLNLHYMRLQLYRGGEEIERAEVTAEDFAALAGSNRLEARGTMTVTLDFFFNSMDFDSGRILVAGADDNGNSIEFALGVLEIEFYDGVLGAAPGP